MKKKIIAIMFCIIVFLGLTGCSSKESKKSDQEIHQERDTEELYSCLENELSGYIVTEKSSLDILPLEDITNKKDKINFYKGFIANKNEVYIIFEMEDPQESEVLESFNKYFSNKFEIYQKYFFGNNAYIFIHNKNNDVDFKEIFNKCNQKKSLEEGKSMPSKTIEQLKKTKKINIKIADEMRGTIDKEETIYEILNIIENAKMYGDNFLCDGTSISFDMYDDKENIIDTVLIWSDGRLIPDSLSKGCGYYSSPSGHKDFKKIIEEETDFIFYNLSTSTQKCQKDKIFIYEDEKYKYYLDCKERGNMNIHFTSTYLTMSLSYALNNKYINIKQLEMYDDLFIKEKKQWEGF